MNESNNIIISSNKYAEFRLDYEVIESGEYCRITGYQLKIKRAAKKAKLKDNIVIDEVTIPSEIDGLPVLVIGDGHSLITVGSCPGDYFIGKLIIPNGIKQVGAYAFGGDLAIKSLIWPESCLSIPQSCFAYSAISEFVIPDSVTEISEFAFNHCGNLTKFDIPKSCKVIGEFAFCDCVVLEEVNIPQTVESIRKGAFSHTDIKKFNWPSNCSVIPHICFNNCRLMQEININGEISRIEMDSFLNTLVKEINLSKNVNHCYVDEESIYYRIGLIEPFYGEIITKENLITRRFS